MQTRSDRDAITALDNGLHEAGAVQFGAVQRAPQAMLVPLVVFFAFQPYFVQGVLAGSVK